MAVQRLLSETERERLWEMTNLCHRYRRMLDELHDGIQQGGARRGMLRDIDPSIEDALWHIQNCVVQTLVLLLVKPSDGDRKSFSIVRVLRRLQSGAHGVAEPLAQEIESAINRYSRAILPLRKDRDRMIAHADRHHSGKATYDLEILDKSLKSLVWALQLVDRADGRSRGEPADWGSALSLGRLIGEGIVARAEGRSAE